VNNTAIPITKSDWGEMALGVCVEGVSPLWFRGSGDAEIVPHPTKLYEFVINTVEVPDILPNWAGNLEEGIFINIASAIFFNYKILLVGEYRSAEKHAGGQNLLVYEIEKIEVYKQMIRERDQQHSLAFTCYPSALQYCYAYMRWLSNMGERFAWSVDGDLWMKQATKIWIICQVMTSLLTCIPTKNLCPLFHFHICKLRHS